MKRWLKDLALIVLGNFVLAFGVSTFILPNDILTGGVAGLAVALYPFFHVQYEVMINILIMSLFFLGWLFLGKQFALKTLASSILYPLFLSFFALVSYEVVLDPLLASIYGGLLTGVGLGLTFMTGASTGGMDIPPLILSKITGIRVALWIMAFDLLIVALGLYAYPLENVLIGFLSIFTTAFAIDKIEMVKAVRSRQVLIISPYYSEIMDVIHQEMNRGSTLLYAKGGYTEEKIPIILSIVNFKEYPILEARVKTIDPDVFMIVSDVNKVHGDGFQQD